MTDSGASYSYRKEKETHELIFSWWSWLAVLLVGAYARRRRRWSRQDGGHSLNYSTINKITQFWLVESSTINPKLYSVGVPIKFPSKRSVRTIISGKFQRQIKSCSQISSCSTMHDEKAKKTGEIIFSVTQNLTCELPQFSRGFGDYACKLHHPLTVRNFVECTINKKSHDLLAQFVINRYSWFWKFSNCTRSCNFENFQNHSY